MNFRKKCLISNVHFFLFNFDFFSFRKNNYRIRHRDREQCVDELMTNWNTLKTICDSLTKYNHIRVCRACFVFYFFSQRILHFDDHAMCSRSSHVLHILYFSVSQTAIQRQDYDRITWCGYNHVMWLRWLCIKRDNFDSNTQYIYKESLILNKILSNIIMRFIIYTFNRLWTRIV
jgi:hypothetical protein